jgi:programmed cell death protein 5
VINAVSNISLVKPEKARALEDQLLRQAQSGNLKEKLSEAQLLQILEKVSGEAQCTKVVVTI